MASTRYLAMKAHARDLLGQYDYNQFPAAYDSIVWDAAVYVAELHTQGGWLYLRNEVQQVGQDHSMAIDANLDSGILPRGHGAWVLRAGQRGNPHYVSAAAALPAVTFIAEYAMLPANATGTTTVTDEIGADDLTIAGTPTWTSLGGGSYYGLAMDGVGDYAVDTGTTAFPETTDDRTILARFTVGNQTEGVVWSLGPTVNPTMELAYGFQGAPSVSTLFWLRVYTSNDQTDYLEWLFPTYGATIVGETIDVAVKMDTGVITLSLNYGPFTSQSRSVGTTATTFDSGVNNVFSIGRSYKAGAERYAASTISSVSVTATSLTDAQMKTLGLVMMYTDWRDVEFADYWALKRWPEFHRPGVCGGFPTYWAVESDNGVSSVQTFGNSASGKALYGKRPLFDQAFDLTLLQAIAEIDGDSNPDTPMIWPQAPFDLLLARLIASDIAFGPVNDERRGGILWEGFKSRATTLLLSEGMPIEKIRFPWRKRNLEELPI